MASTLFIPGLEPRKANMIRYLHIIRDTNLGSQWKKAGRIGLKGFLKTDGAKVRMLFYNRT